MYAVVATGGKQYQVMLNKRYWVEKIEADVGSTVVLDRVLLTAEDGNVVHGAPYIKGATVTCEVVEQGRGKKVRIVKFRRRKDSKSITGHRQWRTCLKIVAIGDKKPQAKKASTKKSDA